MSSSAEPIRPPASRQTRGFLYLSVTAVSWGINWPVIKFLLGEIAPFSMRVLACAIGAACAFALARGMRQKLAVPRGQWGKLIASSTLNFSAFLICSTLSLQFLSASEAVIVAYTLPIWTALLSWPVLGERLTRARMLALACGMAGLAVLMGNQVGPGALAGPKLTGVAIGLTGSILFALGAVLAKRAPLAMPPVSAVAWQVLLGTIPAGALALFEHPDWAGLTPAGWVLILYLSTVPLCIAYVCWFRALQLLPAGTAAIGTLLVPVIGVFTATLTLGEPLGARELTALGLTLGGVALAARGRSGRA